MKFNRRWIFTALVFVCLLFLKHGLALAQTCGPPPETSIITLSDGTELEETHYFGDNYTGVSFVGDGYCLYLSWWPDLEEQITLGINNNNSDWNYDEGVIYVENSWTIDPSRVVVDLSAVPPVYRELWENLQTLCGVLINEDGFWQIFDSVDREQLDRIRSVMEKMRDGYYAPEVFIQFYTIRAGIEKDFQTGQLMRKYSFEGPEDWSVSTPDYVGTENPELLLDIWAGNPSNIWEFRIDPVSATVQAWKLNSNQSDNLDLDDFDPVIKRLLKAVEFSLGQAPSLIEDGIITEGEDFVNLLEKSVYGLTEYPIEIIYEEF